MKAEQDKLFRDLANLDDKAMEGLGHRLRQSEAGDALVHGAVQKLNSAGGFGPLEQRFADQYLEASDRLVLELKDRPLAHKMAAADINWKTISREAALTENVQDSCRIRFGDRCQDALANSMKPEIELMR
ncbi:MAG: hypothetical protein KDJ50_08415 [Alphaproteobacteria bacterium]|nr:hypothetical protein [Alphaproteobacteria bacterium]